MPLRHRKRIRKRNGRRAGVDDVIARSDTIAEWTLAPPWRCRGDATIRALPPTVTGPVHRSTCRTWSNRSRQVVANGASAIEAVTAPAPKLKFSEPLGLIITPFDGAAQVDPAPRVRIAERQHLVVQLDEPGTARAQRDGRRPGTVQHDVERAKDLGIGGNGAAPVTRTNVVEPVVVDPSAVWSSSQVSAHDGRIRGWNGQRRKPAILVGSRRDRRWITVLQKRLLSCCVARSAT